MIVAKPVVDNQFWILREDDRKVGNITATDDGYAVKIENNTTKFKNISMIAQRGIVFEAVGNKKPKTDLSRVHGFPAAGRVYNPTWDVRQGLPLYTKTRKSKSWFCGGWYRIKQHRTWEVVLCPKLITVQRYPHQGPFYTQDQAEQIQPTLQP